MHLPDIRKSIVDWQINLALILQHGFWGTGSRRRIVSCHRTFYLSFSCCDNSCIEVHLRSKARGQENLILARLETVPLLHLPLV